MKRFLLFVFALSLILNQMQAFHIVGGDFTSKWVGGNDFEITMKMFRDCSASNGAPFDQSITVAVFDKITDVRVTYFEMYLGNVSPLHLAGSLCTPPPQVCMEEGTYTETVTLPDNPDGYYLIWERCCRNISIVNMATPSGTGMGFYLEIPDPALHNSSPVFRNDPLPYMCINQPFSYNFSAYDQDGDSLSYNFSTPLAGGHTTTSQPNPFSLSGAGQIPVSEPYSYTTWASGFSINNIIDGNPTLAIDNATGQITAVPLSQGLYAMAVEIKEWRSGVQIGLVRRELEFLVIVCDGNEPPKVNATVPPPSGTTYTVYATDSLCLTIKATDTHDSVFITYSGDVFAGGSTSAPYATSHNASGNKAATTDFCWHPVCSQSSPTPYHVRFTVTDNGCPLPKTKYLDFDIHVIHPPPVDPPNMLCTEFLNDDMVRVYWGSLSSPSRFLSGYLLYRSINGSAFVLLDTIYNKSQYYYVDSNAINNTVIDYCYYIINMNVCGDAGVTSDTICTLSQVNLKTNYITTATVKAPDAISVSWKHFTDAPFSTFYIYKKENSPGGQFNLWQMLSHPSGDFINDYDVQTANYSYTYKMYNEDYCSNKSPESNTGTTILLQGQSTPFVNYIWWTRYETWTGGVKQYEVFRRKDATSEYTLLTVTNNTTYADKELDVTGGEFFYLIKAVEDVGGMNAHSESNELELLQSPQVFIPNAFTPNDDATNETWRPVIVFAKDYSLFVFNRWGQKIFESKNESDSWNGRFNYRDCPQGAYYYMLRFTGYDNPDEIRKTGTVTLVR